MVMAESITMHNRFVFLFGIILIWSFTGCVRAGFDIRYQQKDFSVEDINNSGLSLNDASFIDAQIDAGPPPIQWSTVTTWAGTGVAGYQDGPAASAQFNSPRGIALDKDDNLYVADLYNYRIRKIANGQVTTLAGTGVLGYLDGPAATAQFSSPRSITFNNAGELLIAEKGRIRLFSGGQVSTFAGTGTLGMQDGPIASAMFNDIRSLEPNSLGEIILTEYENIVLRKIANGQVTTFAGCGTAGFINGPAATAQFYQLRNIAIDPANNIYVADAGNNCIRLIANGQVTTFAGTGVAGLIDGPAASAQLNNPHGLLIDPKGRLIVADTGNNCIRIIADGKVTTIAGTGVKGFADGAVTTAMFSDPNDLALDQAGRLFVSDFTNNRIRVLSL